MFCLLLGVGGLGSCFDVEGDPAFQQCFQETLVSSTFLMTGVETRRGRLLADARAPHSCQRSACTSGQCGSIHPVMFLLGPRRQTHLCGCPPGNEVRPLRCIGSEGTHTYDCLSYSCQSQALIRVCVRVLVIPTTAGAEEPKCWFDTHLWLRIVPQGSSLRHALLRRRT